MLFTKKIKTDYCQSIQRLTCYFLDKLWPVFLTFWSILLVGIKLYNVPFLFIDLHIEQQTLQFFFYIFCFFLAHLLKFICITVSIFFKAKTIN